MEHLILSTPPAVAEALYAIGSGILLALLFLIAGRLVGAFIFVIRGYREDALLKLGLLGLGCLFGFYWLHSIETMRWYFWTAVTGKWFDPGLDISGFAGGALLVTLLALTLYALFVRKPSVARFGRIFDRRSILSVVLFIAGAYLLIVHWSGLYNYGSTGSGVGRYRDHTYLSLKASPPFISLYPHPDAEPFLDAIGGVAYLTGQALLLSSALLAAYTLGSRLRRSPNGPGTILAGCVLAIAVMRVCFASLKHNPIAPTPYAVEVPAGFLAPTGTSHPIRDPRSPRPYILVDRYGAFDRAELWPALLSDSDVDSRSKRAHSDRIARFLIDRRATGETVERLLSDCCSLDTWKFMVSTRCPRCDIVRETPTYLGEKEEATHVFTWAEEDWALNGQSLRRSEDIEWPSVDYYDDETSETCFAVDVGSAPSWQHVVDLVSWTVVEADYFAHFQAVYLIVPEDTE